MNKHTEISMLTKQNLMDAFWELYCVKHIEKITVKEITAKAGYNRGTFYEYFVDVYDVLEYIENSLFPEIYDLPPIDLIDVSPIDSFIKMYSTHSKYYTVLLGDKGDPAFAIKLKKSVKEKLKQHFLHSKIDELELEYTLEFILSAMIGVLTHWFKNEKQFPKEKLVVLIYELMNGSILEKLIVQDTN